MRNKNESAAWSSELCGWLWRCARPEQRCQFGNTFERDFAKALQPRSDHERRWDQIAGTCVRQPLRIPRLLVDRLSDVGRAAYEGHAPMVVPMSQLVAGANLMRWGDVSGLT